MKKKGVKGEKREGRGKKNAKGRSHEGSNSRSLQT